MSSATQSIPTVPKQWHGLLGNMPDVDPSFAASSIWHLTELYGPIFQLDFMTSRTIVLSNYEYLQEVLQDEKFEKHISSSLEEVRHIVKDGLFTAYSNEPNWFKAHRILMPVFGPIAVRKMFNDMVDIAGQLILKWDHLGPHQEIDITDDCTRLAFDTIGLCGYSYRFNNFYTQEPHPFVTQMSDSLIEAGKRGGRTKLETNLRYFSQKKLNEDISAMHKLCDDIVQERYDNPDPDKTDLLSTMLNVKDPETDERLSKENVRYQMVTFLIAGHETTSGTLSFLFYNFLVNPDTYHKAQQEVDEVLGDEAITLNHLPKLKYVDACIKETLRMNGPIAMISRHAKKPEIIAGKYAVTPTDSLTVNLRALGTDPAVWGDDAKDFRPERWFEPDVPIHAWKPFGTGARSCIGRAFTEQEMLITVALVLQRFQVTMADPSYNLHLKSTLTIKPHGFCIKVHRRPGKGLMVGLAGQNEHAKQKSHTEVKQAPNAARRPLTILYGSNAGTCRTYADELASDSDRYGFQATVKTLDSAVEHVPSDHPVVIITPSYEGKPADNAKQFCSWLESSIEKPDLLKDVKYLLFGVGNSEWAATYHKVPKAIHHMMGKMGASSVIEPGFVDVKSDAVGPWEEWCEKVWPALLGKDSAPSASSTIKASIHKSTASTILGGFDSTLLTVRENVPLTQGKSGPVKMHMEVELPEGMRYSSGDYLVVLPWNHRENVQRVVKRFKVHEDDMIHVTESRKDFLKTQHPVSIFDLVTSRVELSTPITQRQLEKLTELVSDDNEKTQIKEKGAKFEENFLRKRFSILDVLEDYPSCKLDFVDYLDMLKPLSARQYSISSSPLAPENFTSSKMIASISYDVLEVPALSGSDRTYYGPCSTMLAKAKPGTSITATVRPTNAAFHLPTDPQVPIIMIAAGTGIAPMRAFIQERAALKEARGSTNTLGPALLYFGCRNKDDDYIYRQELEHWESSGVVSLRTCFSRSQPSPDSFRYTSDRLYADKEELSNLFKNGAKIFVCGSASKVGKSTADVCMKIWMEMHPDKSREDAAEWLDGIKEDRYVSDVFG